MRTMLTHGSRQATPRAATQLHRHHPSCAGCVLRIPLVPSDASGRGGTHRATTGAASRPADSSHVSLLSQNTAAASEPPGPPPAAAAGASCTTASQWKRQAMMCRRSAARARTERMDVAARPRCGSITATALLLRSTRSSRSRVR